MRLRLWPVVALYRTCVTLSLDDKRLNPTKNTVRARCLCILSIWVELCSSAMTTKFTFYNLCRVGRSDDICNYVFNVVFVAYRQRLGTPLCGSHRVMISKQLPIGGVEPFCRLPTYQSGRTCKLELDVYVRILAKTQTIEFCFCLLSLQCTGVLKQRDTLP